MRPTLRAVLIAVPCLLPGTALAQDGYLFKAPSVTFTLRGGPTVPAAREGVFDLMTRELTLERGDFKAFSIGADMGITVTPHVDLVFGVSGSRTTRRSEFREWVDQDDKPIEQTTMLKRIPATVSARIYPFERGRAVGKHAWVPGPALQPFVGAGGALVWYTLEQEGDFVDSSTLDVYRDFLHSDNIGAGAHVFAGAEYWAWTRFGIGVEARYSWAKAQMRDGFSEFDSIDLKGMQYTVGFNARF